MPRPPVTPGGRNYHPLTISPALPAGRPASALATFLHEQLHWLDCPGIDAATTEASERWPDPPAPPPAPATVTWLGLHCCSYRSRVPVTLFDPGNGPVRPNVTGAGPSVKNPE